MGHSRDITCVTFNRDCDLLFTCAKDNSVQLWRSKDGQRLGSYDHPAAVNCCDVTARSDFLLTAAGDGVARVFAVETGTKLAEYKHASPTRHCTWAIANEMFAVIQNKGKKNPSRIVVWDFPTTNDGAISRSDQDPDDGPLRLLSVPKEDEDKIGAFHKCVFTDHEFHILAIHNNGWVTLWDSGDECLIASAQLSATGAVLTDIQLTHDRGLALITCRDQKAYLINTTDLSVVKTYQSDRPLNTGCISPILNHTLLAGGQDKHEVTTSTSGGQFEVEFWHTIYEEKLTEVVGHYGPVNTVAMSRDGKMFASGGEEGQVRLYHFDDGYFKCTY